MSSFRSGCSLAIAALVGACTHVHSVHTVVPREGDQAVATTDGKRFQAHPTVDGWVTSAGQFVKPEQVTRSESVSVGRGMVEGLGLGALAGGVGGATLGAIEAARCEPPENCSLPGLRVVIVGFSYSLVGGLVGSVVGGILGSKTVYRRSVPSIQAGPTAGGLSAGLAWRF